MRGKNRKSTAIDVHLSRPEALPELLQIECQPCIKPQPSPKSWHTKGDIMTDLQMKWFIADDEQGILR